MSDIFDSLPKSAPDEYGSWAKGKTQTLRDVFPTPEAFAEAARKALRRHPHPSRYSAHLTADGQIVIDHETGAVHEVKP